MKTIVALAVYILWSVPALCQPVFSVGGFVRGGYARLQTATSLARQVFPDADHPASGKFGTGGCEFFFRHRKAMLTVSALGMGQRYRLDNGSAFDLSASTRHLKVGWIIYHNDRWQVYPSLGPGLTTVSLARTGRGAPIITHVAFYTTDVSFSGDVQLNKPKSGNAPADILLLGFRVGCQIGDSEPLRPAGSAVARMSGFYATLTLGGGIGF